MIMKNRYLEKIWKAAVHVNGTSYQVPSGIHLHIALPVILGISYSTFVELRFCFIVVHVLHCLHVVSLAVCTK